MLSSYNSPTSETKHIVFLGLLSGRAGPKLQPQASNPEQHNNTTTRRLYGVDTILPHLTTGFLQRPHEHLMCIPRVLYEFLPSASQRFPQSGWVISSGKLSQVLGDRPLQDAQPRRWPKLLEFVLRSWVKGAHRPPVPIGYFLTGVDLGWWSHHCCPLPSVHAVNNRRELHGRPAPYTPLSPLSR